MNDDIPGLDEIRAAHTRIEPYIHLTPVFTNTHLDALSGTSLFFKCENFQKGGAFKVRGAFNAILSLSDKQARRGVVTHSSGNHAAAVALAAQQRGIPAYIVMPSNANPNKREAVIAYGGIITPCEPTVADREATAETVRAKTGAKLIHPYDNRSIIAGQGTATLEFLAQTTALDILICSVGGGGLLAGTALAAKLSTPGMRVIAAEPSGADDALRSFRSRTLVAQLQPNTIADGLLTSLGERNFTVLLRHVDDVISVTDAAIVDAMKQVWQFMKIIVEPSAAVGLAAVLASMATFRGLRIGVILSGGNADLDNLPWLKAFPKSPE